MASIRWRVTHTFDPPVRLVDRLFPSIQGLEFVADERGLHTIHHDIDTGGAVTRDLAARQSRRDLQGAMAAFRYLQIGPLHWWSDASMISPPETGLRLSGRGTATVGTRAIEVPARGWSGDLAAEVLTWILLASQAQESSSPAVRLRLYFLILEDFHGRGQLDDGARGEYDLLKPVRDFVSHPKISRGQTLEKLRAVAPALADVNGDFAYDPYSATQEVELLAFSDRARRLVDATILREVGVRSDYWK